jgi:hypothetical protein
MHYWIHQILWDGAVSVRSQPRNSIVPSHSIASEPPITYFSCFFPPLREVFWPVCYSIWQVVWFHWSINNAVVKTVSNMYHHAGLLSSRIFAEIYNTLLSSVSNCPGCLAHLDSGFLCFRVLIINICSKSYISLLNTTGECYFKHAATGSQTATLSNCTALLQLYDLNWLSQLSFLFPAQ